MAPCRLYRRASSPFPPSRIRTRSRTSSSPFEQIPAQQVPFYDEAASSSVPDDSYFGDWMIYAMKAALVPCRPRSSRP